LVKSYLYVYIDKSNKLRQIICAFKNASNASQFVRFAQIRKQYGLALYKYFQKKDIFYWYFHSKNASEFVKNVHIRKEYGLKLYKAIKSCITIPEKPKEKWKILREIEERKKKPKVVRKKNYVRFTVSGLVRDNQNHDCVAYIHFYFYSDAEMFDEIVEQIEYNQQIARDVKYLNEYYDEYGLTISYEYVDESDVEKERLITDIKQIDDIMDNLKNSIECGRRKGRVDDVLDVL